MKEEFRSMLLAKTLEEDTRNIYLPTRLSGFKLSAKSGKGLFNVKKDFYDKNSDTRYSGFINYYGGYALVTNGHEILVNAEKYAEVYEETRVNFITGEMQMGIFPSPKKWDFLMEQLDARHTIEVDDMLAAIDKQAKQYNQAKIDNDCLAKDMKNNIAGLIRFTWGNKGDYVAFGMAQCNLIKRFIEQCEKNGGCAIGICLFQAGNLKIVGNGMMLIVNGCICDEEAEATIEINNKVKPINK